MKRTIVFLLSLFTLALNPSHAQKTDSVRTNTQTPPTTVKRTRSLPLVTTKIRLLTRSYGDSIVLRWIAEDYVSYNYLATLGVNVLRVTRDSTMFPLHSKPNSLRICSAAKSAKGRLSVCTSKP